GMLNWLNGTGVTYTSAPLTDWLQLSETCSVATIDVVDAWIGRGVTLKRSTFRRAGAVSLATAAVPVPGGQPVAGVCGTAVITAVGAEVAEAEAPVESVALTRTRSVSPTSTCCSL